MRTINLGNETIELKICEPGEGYRNARFDWTGKLVEVKYKDMALAGAEGREKDTAHLLGRGFFNEFGMEDALGFRETPMGEWFHKIGVGLLKKDKSTYEFGGQYDIRPAHFETKQHARSVSINCTSENTQGYAYTLDKTYTLLKDGFNIEYHLHNLGVKPIITEEYVHNFLNPGPSGVGSHCRLTFPFNLKPERFEEVVDPECIMVTGEQEIGFSAPPKQVFFFSHLNGKERVPAGWLLSLGEQNLFISEEGDFQCEKVNLWGNKHVISPEIFHQIHIEPGKATQWNRRYTITPF